VAFDLDLKGQYKMQGFIDRLGRDDEGTLWIHDYKTSSRKLSEEDVKNEDQLALYQIGLAQSPQFGATEKIKLIWHFVAFEKDQVVSERNPKELGWLKEKYISKIETIEKTKSYFTKPGVLCQWCEYLSVCSDGKVWVANKKKKSDAKAAIEPVPTPVAIKSLSPSTVSPDFAEKPAKEAAIVTATPKVGEAVNPKKRKSPFRYVSPDQLSLFK
jgi:hypothetical protein